jgi:hypothetical protein
MIFSDDFWRAVQDYTLQFPTLESLGENASAWLAVRNAAKATARASVLITSGTAEGGSGSGQRNFSQSVLIDALDYRRHQLDASYTLPVHLRRDDASALVISFAPPSSCI